MLKSAGLRKAVRVAAVGVELASAVLAVLLVVALVTDLGPSLRGLAEREGSRRIERPMHIGKLSVRLFAGRFVVEDFTIEGLTPSDRPFLKAKRIEASLVWSALWHREVLVDAVEMTDWEMVVETFAGGRHSFPRFAAGSSRAAPVHDHDAVRACVARRLHARRPRHALEHGGAQSGRHRRQGQRLPGTGQLLGRHGHDPELRADVGRHEGLLPDRRQPAPLRPDRAADRRRRNPPHRRRGRRAVARAALPGALPGALPAHAGDLLRPRDLQPVRRRGLHGHVPPLQGGARTEGRVHERGGRRERVPVSRPARIAPLAARPVRGDRGDLPLLRRDDALHLRRWLRSGPPGPRRPCSTPRTRMSTWRSSPTSSSWRGSGSRAAPPAGTASSGRSGASRSIGAGAASTSRAGARARDGWSRRRRSSVRAWRTRSRRRATRRLPASSSTASIPSGSTSTRAACRRPPPPSPSRAARRTASDPAYRSTWRAPTGRRATGCWRES